ncbi:MAG: hypothetical protein EBU67_07795 [Actinobacteria bacterium]|nr:hypothetical protein [Actinomycetota bacterium]
MGIDKAGDKRGPIDVDDFCRVTVAPAHHRTIANREAGVDPFLRDRGQHSSTTYEKVGGFVAARSCESPERNGWSRHVETLVHWELSPPR